MHNWNAKASLETSKEAHKIVEGLSKVFEKIHKKYNKKELYDKLSQEITDENL